MDIRQVADAPSGPPSRCATVTAVRDVLLTPAGARSRAHLQQQDRPQPRRSAYLDGSLRSGKVATLSRTKRNDIEKEVLQWTRVRFGTSAAAVAPFAT